MLLCPLRMGGWLSVDQKINFCMSGFTFAVHRSVYIEILYPSSLCITCMYLQEFLYNKYFPCISWSSGSASTSEVVMNDCSWLYEHDDSILVHYDFPDQWNVNIYAMQNSLPSRGGNDNHCVRWQDCWILISGVCSLDLWPSDSIRVFGGCSPVLWLISLSHSRLSSRTLLWELSPRVQRGIKSVKAGTRSWLKWSEEVFFVKRWKWLKWWRILRMGVMACLLWGWW